MKAVQVVTLTGRPGELLLHLFGRDAAVEVGGPDAAVEAWSGPAPP